MRVGIGMALTARQPLSLVARAIGILRSYGADAHIYLPGVGTVNGITAGNYLDSAGTTSASVDNPVGLSLDALQAMTLGDELVTNGDFASGTTGWTGFNGTLANVSGALQLTQTTGGYCVAYVTLSGLTVGKTYAYAVTFVSMASATNSQVWVGSAPASAQDLNRDRASTATGTVTGTFVAGATSRLFQVAFIGASVVASIDNISVREIPGIHASQATTSNKGLLRLTSGKYNWVFDSTDLLTATFPAGNESVTVIDSFLTGQVTTTGVNVVGAYSMGPSVTLYGRMIIKGSISASELLVLQRFANSWAGL